MHYCIKLSYCGAAFRGWQRQPSAPSVQQTLEEALGRLLGADTPVIGAGRTDTAVNAIGYVACFDGPEGLAAEDFRYKLNAILPRDVAVDSVAPADPGFHARFDAVRREYTYFIHRRKDPFMNSFSWQCGYPGLDFDAMNKAATMLVGTHDFSCFEKVGADNKTSVCTVYEAFWKPYMPTHLQVMGDAAGTFPSQASYGRAMQVPGSPCGTRTCPLPAAEGRKVPAAPTCADQAVQEPQYWFFRISADRFLRNMVRAIVGTLVEVGRGKRSIKDFAGLVLPVSPSDGNQGQKNRENPSRRSLAGESVPGHALFLSNVEY